MRSKEYTCVDPARDFCGIYFYLATNDESWWRIQQQRSNQRSWHGLQKHD